MIYRQADWLLRLPPPPVLLGPPYALETSMGKAERQWALPHIIVSWSWSPRRLWAGGTMKGTKLYSVPGADIWYPGGLGEL